MTTKTKLPALTLADLAHVRRCLDLLQEAQTLIDAAAQALCPVPGFGNQWSRLGVPYAVVKQNWHRVEARRQQLASRTRANP